MHSDIMACNSLFNLLNYFTVKKYCVLIGRNNHSAYDVFVPVLFNVTHLWWKLETKYEIFVLFLNELSWYSIEY